MSEDGWISWRGGENPVLGKRVDVMWSNGKQTHGGYSEGWCWDTWEPDQDYAEEGDIVAYRVCSE